MVEIEQICVLFRIQLPHMLDLVSELSKAQNKVQIESVARLTTVFAVLKTIILTVLSAVAVTRRFKFRREVDL
jgi:hypothetical protein